MKIKTIIVDLDRTLLHTDKKISPYTAVILNECKKRGIKIMVATARPLRAIKEYCEVIAFDAMVVSNGARIIWGEQRKEYGINQKSTSHILQHLKNYPSFCITLETGDCAYSNMPIEDYETVISADLARIAKREGALKLIVNFDDEKTLSAVESVLPKDVYYTIANGHLIQIMNKSATKWSGIKAMLELSECSTGEAIYFGDDHDDIEPIQMCGIGVAVANGIEEVKAIADDITESNDEDGVAKYLEQLLKKM